MKIVYNMSICDANCNSKNKFFIIQLNCGHKFHFSCFSGTEYNKHCLNCKRIFLKLKSFFLKILGYILLKNFLLPTPSVIAYNVDTNPEPSLRITGALATSSVFLTSVGDILNISPPWRSRGTL